MVPVPGGATSDGGAQRSERWYHVTLLRDPWRDGERMFLACDGGPCRSRLETFPPRLEIEERNGLYVLVDDGPVETWRYRSRHGATCSSRTRAPHVGSPIGMVGRDLHAPRCASAAETR